MFIAVINENFDVAEEAKKGQQASQYWAAEQRDLLGGSSGSGFFSSSYSSSSKAGQGQQDKTQAQWAGWLSIRSLNPYRWVKKAPVKVKVDKQVLKPGLVLGMRREMVVDYTLPKSFSDSASNLGTLDEKSTSGPIGYGFQRAPTGLGFNRTGTAFTPPNTMNTGRGTGPRHYPTRSLTMLQRLFAGSNGLDTHSSSHSVPLRTMRQQGSSSTTAPGHNKQRSEGAAAPAPAPDEAEDEISRHLELIASINNPSTGNGGGGGGGEDLSDALHERRALKADFIRDHPSYDYTFWVFSQSHPLRQWCQALVQPANGERIFGRPPSRIAHPMFQLVILLAVIGGIVVESIATPLYRREFYLRQGLFRGAWFDIAESAFGLALVGEFIIKLIADGFVFTPNAYLRSIWNILDFFIMIGVLVNVTTTLIFIGGLSRFTRSLKALRALRLITLIDIMRTTFQSLILSGALRILDAAILAILYMIPYAVWGLNIFNGKLGLCNDETVQGVTDCVNEFSSSTFEGSSSFTFPAPRVWDNPSPSTRFSFDSFRASLLILFEIVSLEGWIDVMNSATSITGEGQQPSVNNSQFNAVFFLIYNLMGAVVILTLFVRSVVCPLRHHFLNSFVSVSSSATSLLKPGRRSSRNSNVNGLISRNCSSDSAHPSVRKCVPYLR